MGNLGKVGRAIRRAMTTADYRLQVLLENAHDGPLRFVTDDDGCHRKSENAGSKVRVTMSKELDVDCSHWCGPGVALCSGWHSLVAFPTMWLIAIVDCKVSFVVARRVRKSYDCTNSNIYMMSETGAGALVAIGQVAVEENFQPQGQSRSSLCNNQTMSPMLQKEKHLTDSLFEHIILSDTFTSKSDWSVRFHVFCSTSI